MSRAHRVALLFGLCTVLYLLALFQYFPVPFVDDKVLQEILPLVSFFCSPFQRFLIRKYFLPHLLFITADIVYHGRIAHLTP